MLIRFKDLSTNQKLAVYSFIGLLMINNGAYIAQILVGKIPSCLQYWLLMNLLPILALPMILIVGQIEKYELRSLMYFLCIILISTLSVILLSPTISLILSYGLLACIVYTISIFDAFLTLHETKLKLAGKSFGKQFNEQVRLAHDLWLVFLKQSTWGIITLIAIGGGQFIVYQLGIGTLTLGDIVLYGIAILYCALGLMEGVILRCFNKLAELESLLAVNRDG